MRFFSTNRERRQSPEYGDHERTIAAEDEVLFGRRTPAVHVPPRRTDLNVFVSATPDEDFAKEVLAPLLKGVKP